MNKIKEFLQTNIIVLKWTACYFIGLWCILEFLFGFNLLSSQHWYKFFHSSFHGFAGFTFQIIMYAALPIFIASVMTIYRTKEPIIKIALFDKIKEYIKNLKPAPLPEQTEETTDENESESENIYPNDLPPELRIPFKRVRDRIGIRSPVSVYNQIHQTPETKPSETISDSTDAFPIPSDFDIPDTFDENDTLSLNEMPVFQDLDFDTPIMSEQKLENETTKYFDNKKIEYETNKNFVITDEYVIYEHNDDDFWIMDDEAWFAAGKQIESPVPELLQIAQINNLTPIIYMKSENIMDIETTISNFENNGVRVIKGLSELD